MERPAPTPIEQLLNFYYATYLPNKPSFNVDSPVQPAAQHNGRAHCYKKLIRRLGRRQLHSEVEAIASSCFAQILAE